MDSILEQLRKEELINIKNEILKDKNRIKSFLMSEGAVSIEKANEIINGLCTSYARYSLAVLADVWKLGTEISSDLLRV